MTTTTTRTERSVAQLADASDCAGNFATEYFQRLKTILDSVDVSEITRLAEALEEARSEGRTVFVAGNGGSATTATSMAQDLGFDVLRKTGTSQPFRMLALTDNNAVLTAVGNDVGYDEIFVSQLRIHFRPGDLLILISASGNSPNTLRAAEWVKSRNGKVIGLLGFTGGALQGMCDIVVHVASQAGEYGPVEDAHLVINHVLAHWFQVRLRQ